MRLKYTSITLMNFAGAAATMSLVLMFATPLQAATFYVAKSGNDSNSGSESQPFLTVLRGVASLASGDTLFIDEGIYNERLVTGPPDYLTIAGGTSWDNATTIKAKSGKRVVLRPAGGASPINFYSDALSNHLQYVIIDGLVLDGINAKDGVVNIQGGPNHIRVQNCEIMNGYGGGVSIFYNRNTYVSSDYNEILNCDIHHNGRMGGVCERSDCKDANGNPIQKGHWFADTAPGYGRAHGLYINGSYNIFDGNRIHHNGQAGVQIFYSYREDYPYEGNVVRNNLIYDNSLNITRTGHPTHPGIILSGRSGMAYNNIIWGNWGGIDVSYDAVDSVIMHNTIYDNLIGISVGNPWTPTDNTYVVNNLLLSNDSGIRISEGSVRNTILERNLLYQSGTIEDYGQSTQLRNNLLNIDPRLTGAANQDFVPKDGSGAIDQGVALTQYKVGLDINKAPRPQGDAPDIGAIESGGTVPAPPVEPTLPDLGPKPTTTAPHTASNLVIDAQLGECVWQKASWKRFSNSEHSDNTVDFAMAWSDQNLYMAVEVTDADLQTGGSEIYLNDGAELYLDTLHDQTASMNGDDWFGLVDISAASTSDDIVFATVATETGYRLELSVSWDAIGTSPTVGKTMGLLVANNDRDDSQNGQFDWVGLIATNNYAQPLLWGELSLESTVSCTSTPNDEEPTGLDDQSVPDESEDCIPIDISAGDGPQDGSTKVTNNDRQQTRRYCVNTNAPELITGCAAFGSDVSWGLAMVLAAFRVNYRRRRHHRQP